MHEGQLHALTEVSSWITTQTGDTAHSSDVHTVHVGGDGNSETVEVTTGLNPLNIYICIHACLHRCTY